MGMCCTHLQSFQNLSHFLASDIAPDQSFHGNSSRMNGMNCGQNDSVILFCNINLVFPQDEFFMDRCFHNQLQCSLSTSQLGFRCWQSCNLICWSGVSGSISNIKASTNSSNTIKSFNVADDPEHQHWHSSFWFVDKVQYNKKY